MVLAYNNRFSTDDVDATLYPVDEVLVIAADVGSRLGLRTDWLDSSVGGHIPSTKEPEWTPVITFGSVEVAVADKRTMLAMKIRASRGRRDEADVAFLLDACSITTLEEAMELYDEYFPEDEAPARSRPMIEHALHQQDRG